MSVLISLLYKGCSRIFSSTVQKHQFFGTQPFFMIQLSHPYLTTGKTLALITQTFISKVISLLFNILFNIPQGIFSSVQSLSRVQLFATQWTTAHQASLSITNSQSPPKPMSIELVMLSNHLIFCRPLLLRYPDNTISYVVLYYNKFIILFI